MFIRHQILRNDPSQLHIVLYSDPMNVEFATPLGEDELVSDQRIHKKIQEYLNRNFFSINKYTKVTIVSGMVVVGTLSLFPGQAKAESTITTEKDNKFNMGYLFYGSSSKFVQEVDATGGTVNRVSPSFFELDQDGNLSLTWQFDPTFSDQMHQRGVKVVPFLTNNWDQALARTALANRTALAKQIADTVNQYNMDGVNIDLENLTEADKDAYTDFIRLLKAQLPNKEVSVAVAANPYGWKVGWQASYDYKSLASVCDYLFLMAYDETSQGDPPGPVASYDFVNKSIQYALSQNVPPEKLVLGLPSYGRYWKQGDATGGYGITDYQIQQMLQQYQNTVTYDPVFHSSKATITIGPNDPPINVFGKDLSPGTYTVWYENDQSISEKAALANQYNLKGTGEWSLGLETPSFWNAIQGEDTSAPTVTSSPAASISTDKTTTQYTVQSGDSLYAIANKFGVTVDSLISTNNLKSDTILIGQVLTIPATGSTQQSTPVSAKLVRTNKQGIGLFINGKEYIPDQPPIIMNNRTLVPIRTVAEALGATVDWKPGSTVVTITKGGLTITLNQYSNTAYINGKKQTLDTSTIIKNGRTMVPIRFVCEAFGLNVNFDNNINSVVVDNSTSNQTSTVSSAQSSVTQTTATAEAIPSVNNLNTTKTTSQPNISSSVATTTAPANVLAPLAIGSSGQNVQNLQQAIRILNYFTYPTNTGYYGQVTSDAITTFQRDYGIQVTGSVDKTTADAINHAIVKHTITNDANKYIGVPYKWGGTDPSGFDCSGFVYYMFSTHGVNMQRTTSASLFNMGTSIEKSNLKPGDLVFYAINTPGVISHVGFYIGNNQFISATSSKGIQIVSMDNTYWAPKYVGAKRVY